MTAQSTTPATSRGGMSVMRMGIIYTAGNVASAAVPLLLLPLLTRVLDTADYGRAVNFFMLVSLSGALAGLTLHGAMGVRWFLMDRLEFARFGATCLTLIGFSTLLAAGVLVVAVGLIGIDLGLGLIWVALAALAAGAATALNCQLALWQSQRRPLLAAATQFVNSLVNVGLSVVGVVALGLGARGRMGGAALASLLMAAFATLSLVRTGGARGRPTVAHIRTALRFGAPLVPHTLAGVLMVTADRFMVTSLMGTTAVGVYGVAAQLGTVTSILGDAFGKAYGPWMYERLQSGTTEANLAVIGAIYLAIPAFLALAVFATLGLWLVGPWILGTQFSGALSFVGWFALGGAFNGMYVAVAGFFFFSTRTELISLATVASGLCGVALAYWLVKAFGLHGGGAAFATTHAICFALTLTLAVRMRKMPWGRPVAAVRATLRGMR